MPPSAAWIAGFSNHLPILESVDEAPSVAPGRIFSRDSSESRGDSPSPPTSVHAFADHTRRRDRANTVDRAPSIELPDVNNGEIAPAHRRGTFSDGREDKEEDEESTATSVENDVCYPQSDIVEGEPSIDFEELEEFVAETAQMLSPRPVSLPETAGETTRVNTEHRAHFGSSISSDTSIRGGL